MNVYYRREQYPPHVVNMKREILLRTFKSFLNSARTLARESFKKNAETLLFAPLKSAHTPTTSHNIYYISTSFAKKKRTTTSPTPQSRARAPIHSFEDAHSKKKQRASFSRSRSPLSLSLSESQFFKSKITCEKIARVLTTTTTARRSGINVPKNESATKKKMPTRGGKANATLRTRFCTRSRSSPTRTRARFFLSSLDRAV